MERGQRQASGNRTKVSAALAALAAKREGRSTVRCDSALLEAAIVPLPSELEDEEEESFSLTGVNDYSGGSKPPPGRLSRLVRKDMTGAAAAAPTAAADVDSLLGAMQSVTLQQQPRPGSQQRHVHAYSSSGSEGSDGDSHGSEDDDAGTSDSGSDSTSTAAPAAVQQASAASPDDAASEPIASEAGCLELEGGYCLDARTHGMLYAHQVQGVRWLWGLQRAGRGGILGDDMGLGKTMQVKGGRISKGGGLRGRLGRWWGLGRAGLEQHIARSVSSSRGWRSLCRPLSSVPLWPAAQGTAAMAIV